MFVKKGEYDRVRFTVSLGNGTENAQFSANLTDGTIGSLFSTSGINVTSRGFIPIGACWFMFYATVTFGFGFTSLNTKLSILSKTGVLDHLGIANEGIYVWGAKLTNQQLGTYTSVLGTKFYTNTEYNIKTYTIERLIDYIYRALADTLASPSSSAAFYKFYDSVSANYNANTAMTLVRSSLDIIQNQLSDSEYYTTITENNALPVLVQSSSTTSYSSGYTSSGSGSSVTSTLTKFYGDRDIPVGISGELVGSDYIYSTTSDAAAEIQSITLMRQKLLKFIRDLELMVTSPMDHSL